MDEITEFALEEMLAGSDSRRRALVRHMCERWPNEPALSLVFALTSAASTIEDSLRSDRDPVRLAAFTYRLAALLAADVYAVECMGSAPAKATDLLHFWRRVDPYFLDL